VGGGVSANSLVAENCTINGNSTNPFAITSETVRGGGISAVTANLTNCTVSGNTSTNGGGISTQTGLLVNVTVTKNVADVGGGIFHKFDSPSFPKEIRAGNSIVAQNIAATSPDVDGPFRSQGHNLIGNPTGSTGFTGPGDKVGTATNPLDPK